MKDRKKNKSARFFASVFGLMLSVILVACGAKEEIYVEEASMLESPQNLPSAEQEADVTDPEIGLFQSQLAVEQIYVQVCGAVMSPGVYALDSGSRVFEAVALAGGMLEAGDLASLNQAEILADGQMVYVLTKEEAAERKESAGGTVPEANSAGGSENSDGKVNINTAGVAELTSLPGIGAAKAESIIAWREENGAFQAPEDLMKITGIKDGVYSKIKDKIKVD